MREQRLRRIEKAKAKKLIDGRKSGQSPDAKLSQRLAGSSSKVVLRPAEMQARYAAAVEGGSRYMPKAQSPEPYVRKSLKTAAKPSRGLLDKETEWRVALRRPGSVIFSEKTGRASVAAS